MSLPAVEDTPSSTIIGSLSPCSSLLSLDDSFQTDFSHGLEIIPKLNKETELGIHNENKLSDIIPENISNENTTTKEDENDEQDLWEVKKIDGKKKFHGDWYYKVIWADGTSTWYLNFYIFKNLFLFFALLPKLNS
ncbi:hypothetical protein HMI55_002216 [Coelomomyces lativittatus]|nr:hypothetical protein HMI55_002216 [Coelomomyces lativittatus]